MLGLVHSQRNSREAPVRFPASLPILPKHHAPLPKEPLRERMQSKARRKIAVSRGFGTELERWPNDIKGKKVHFMGFDFRNIVIVACHHHTQALVCHSRRISFLSAVIAVDEKTTLTRCGGSRPGALPGARPSGRDPA